MNAKQEYTEKGYSEAEVEILLTVNTIKTNQDIILKNYVKRSEFEPIQKLVYGMVAIILIAVMGALVALVVIQ